MILSKINSKKLSWWKAVSKLSINRNIWILVGAHTIENDQETLNRIRLRIVLNDSSMLWVKNHLLSINQSHHRLLGTFWAVMLQFLWLNMINNQHKWIIIAVKEILLLRMVLSISILDLIICSCSSNSLYQFRNQLWRKINCKIKKYIKISWSKSKRKMKWNFKYTRNSKQIWLN